jgi:phosphohistidine phosphatase SixA
MKLHLWLVRHAVAWEREKWLGRDAERPLTEEGARQFSQFLKTLPWRLKWYKDPWILVSSDYTRAVQTADLFERFAKKKNRSVVRGPKTPHLRPLASPASFRGMLLEQIVYGEETLSLSSGKNKLHIFCFSHEPYLSRLAVELVFPQKAGGSRGGLRALSAWSFLRFKKGAFLHLVWPKALPSGLMKDQESRFLQSLSHPAQMADFWRP